MRTEVVPFTTKPREIKHTSEEYDGKAAIGVFAQGTFYRQDSRVGNNCHSHGFAGTLPNLQEVVGFKGIQLSRIERHGSHSLAVRGLTKDSQQDVVVKFMCSCDHCKGGLLKASLSDDEKYWYHRECFVSHTASDRVGGIVADCFMNIDSEHDPPFIVLQAIPPNFTPLRTEKTDKLGGRLTKGGLRTLSKNLLALLFQFMTPSRDGSVIVHGDLDGNIMVDLNSFDLRLIDFDRGVLCKDVVIKREGESCDDCLEPCLATELLSDFKNTMFWLMIETDVPSALLFDEASSTSSVLCEWDFDSPDMRWPFDPEMYLSSVLTEPCAKLVKGHSMALLRWVADVEKELSSLLEVSTKVPVKSIERLTSGTSHLWQSWKNDAHM